MRLTWNAISFLAAAALSEAAFAGPGLPLPEPGVLELAGLGAAVAIAAIWVKKRRK